MRKVPALLAIGLAMAAGGFGQTKPAPAHQRETTPAPAKTAGAAKKSDKEIEAAIRAKFAKSKINADKFQVHVQGGVATIEGRTEVVQHKGVATRLAKTGGALAVNNRIQTSDAAKKKAADNLDQGRRRAQVKRGDSRSDADPPRSGH
ncbi:MAG: BON domain-containing protein [Bryobacteraceae bacterium]|jgi:hypothetical protein